jgi:hypothetical protein
MTGNVEPITEADVGDLIRLFDTAGPFVAARTLSDYWLYARLFSATCLCIHARSQVVAAVIAFKDQTPGANEICPRHRRRRPVPGPRAGQVPPR